MPGGIPPPSLPPPARSLPSPRTRSRTASTAPPQIPPHLSTPPFDGGITTSMPWTREQGGQAAAGDLEQDLLGSIYVELQASSDDSACSLQWTIQMKDKQIAVIAEKLNSHLALFNSVGKEVSSVTQVLADVECLVGEKENVANASVEYKSRIDTGSNQDQSPESLTHPALASPDPVTEASEKPKCCDESKDIEMLGIMSTVVAD